MTTKKKTTPKKRGGKRVHPEPCPQNKGHKNTRVYNTIGRVRHCVCDDCGHTWKQAGPFSDPLREFCVSQLVPTLKDAQAAKDEDGNVVLTADILGQIEKEVTELVAS